MPGDDNTLDEKIHTLEEFSEYLFDLANNVHEHADMLFRLSDNAKAEAAKLSRQRKRTTD